MGVGCALLVWAGSLLCCARRPSARQRASAGCCSALCSTSALALCLPPQWQARAHLRAALWLLRAGGGSGGGDGAVRQRIATAKALCEEALLASLPAFLASSLGGRCERLRQLKPPTAVNMGHFSLIRRIGTGTYGEVHAARKEDTLGLFALKVRVMHARRCVRGVRTPLALQCILLSNMRTERPLST